MEDYIEKLVECIDLSQKKPLNGIIYEGMRKAIIQGVVPVGERINEQAYSEYLNISRTPIRNAIEKLCEEGIIERIPNYGVVIKRVTVADAEEIYKIRIALDILATQTAMAQMTEEDHREMQLLLEKTQQLDQEGNVPQVIALFLEFNSLIYKFARMPKLKITVARLQQYLARFRDISLFDEVRRKEAFQEHCEIHAALRERNEEVISKMINDHLNRSKDFVVQEILRSEQVKPAGE